MVVCAVLEVVGGVLTYIYIDNYPTPREVQMRSRHSKGLG